MHSKGTEARMTLIYTDRIYYYLFRFENWVIDVVNCVVSQKTSFISVSKCIHCVYSVYRCTRSVVCMCVCAQKWQTIITKRFESYFYHFPSCALCNALCMVSFSQGIVCSLCRMVAQSQRIERQWAKARTTNAANENE